MYYAIDALLEVNGLIIIKRLHPKKLSCNIIHFDINISSQPIVLEQGISSNAG